MKGNKIRLLVALAVVASLLQGMLPTVAFAQTAEPAPNPDLVQACGLDVILVLDESASIDSTAAAVRAGANALVDALADTGSWLAIVDFDYTASTVVPWTEVTTGETAFSTYLTTGYSPGGGTNWEDAFWQVTTLQGSAPSGNPPLVVFFTDGNANTYNGNQGSFDGPGSTTGYTLGAIGGDADAVEDGVLGANAVKAAGSHIFVVGVEGSTGLNVTWIQDISGTDEYVVSPTNPGETDDFSIADYTLQIVLNETAQAGYAFESASCVRKTLTTSGVEEASFTVTLPDALVAFGTNDIVTCDVYNEALPDVSITKTANPTLVPETGGNVDFTIVVTNNGPEDATIDSLVDSDFDLAAHCSDAVGTVLAPAGELGDSYTCVFTEYLTGDDLVAHENTATVVASDDDGNDDTEFDDETVTFEDVAPAIQLTKSASPSSVPETGGDVTFTFLVENIGPEDVTLTSLTDTIFGDLNGQGDCATGGLIPIDGSYSCSITVNLSADDLAAHTNVATANAVNDDNTPASDDDETVTFEDIQPDISVDKTANQAQVFAPGENVVFTVVVNNNSVSTDPVTINSLIDDIHGDVSSLPGDCSVPQTIQPGSSYTCSFTALVDGDETDTVTAQGEDDEGNPVSDWDDAYVEMINPSIDIEKSTNGDDADAAPGPEILVGGAVTWQYLVINNGDVPLTDILVEDNRGVVITCPSGNPIPTLSVGESETCTATGTAAADQYANTGTASASYTDADGDVANRSDSDDSHYFGADPSFTVSKACNSPEPVPQEGPAVFVVTFTNTGNVAVDITADDGIPNFTLPPHQTRIFEVSDPGPFSGSATADNTVTATGSWGDQWTSDAQPASASCAVGSRLNVRKTTNGQVDSSYEWNFAIYAGAHYGDGSGFLGQEPLATGTTSNGPDGMLDFGNLNLDPDRAYTVCEVPTNATAGWAPAWSINGQAYNPHSFDDFRQSLGYYCVDIGAGTVDPLTAGGTLVFDVNNSYPGGGARTPGYWKNWSSCTGGGQWDRAVTNDPDNEFWALDELLFDPGFTIGIRELSYSAYGDPEFPDYELCMDGVSILTQSDIETGRKRASDSAYTLAMHLLAYELNQEAGACQSDAADAAAAAGQNLLASYGFDGTGGYLRPKGQTHDDYYYALDLKDVLDDYNNNLLCGAPVTTDYPPLVSITSPLNGDVIGDGGSNPVNSIVITASAADNNGVTGVVFNVNGESLGASLSGDVWSATWNLGDDGDYTITAEATDTAGQTASDSIVVTVDNEVDPILVDIQVASLQDSSAWLNKGNWEATVTISVDPQSAGADVSGVWSNGATATCMTNASGECSVVLGGISKKSAELTFTVTDIAPAGYAFVPSGFDTVTVFRPEPE